MKKNIYLVLDVFGDVVARFSCWSSAMAYCRSSVDNDFLSCVYNPCNGNSWSVK